MIFTREVPPEKNRYSLRSMMLPNVFTMVLAALCVYPFQLGAQDIRDVPADLTVPGMGDGVPVAGKRVRQVHPDYKGTSVHHALYLPDDWIPGKSYPVIVEYTGNGGYRNEFGDACDGRVEGASLGYGISGGSGCIWIVLPYLSESGTANVTKWWGDAPTFRPDATVAYAKKTVPWVCKEYGGDPDRVVLAGFSRGSIACNYIGLHDDEIAKLWKAFVCYSHYDGERTGWPYPNVDKPSAIRRLKRLGGRPQYILSEAGTEGIRKFIESTGIPGDFTYAATGFRNHNDAWVLRPSPARDALRLWLQKVTQRRQVEGK
jgi:hypothetical protein